MSWLHRLHMYPAFLPLAHTSHTHHPHTLIAHREKALADALARLQPRILAGLTPAGRPGGGCPLRALSAVPESPAPPRPFAAVANLPEGEAMGFGANGPVSASAPQTGGKKRSKGKAAAQAASAYAKLAKAGLLGASPAPGGGTPEPGEGGSSGALGGDGGDEGGEGAGNGGEEGDAALGPEARTDRAMIRAAVADLVSAAENLARLGAKEISPEVGSGSVVGAG